MKRLTCKWQFFNKTVIIESILIMLLLPLLFMKNPIPEASEHSLAIGVLLALMCSCIFKSLYRHKIIINTSNIDLLILLTLGYFLLRSSLSIGQFDLDICIRLLLFLSCYYLAKRISTQMYLRILYGMVLIGVIISTIILLQIGHLLPSRHTTLLPTGLFENPSISGFFLASIFPMTFKGGGKFSEEHKRLIHVFRVFIILGLAATASRASWLCCTVSILLIYNYVSYTKIKNYYTKNRFRVLGLLIVGLVLLLIILAWKFESAYSRLYIWRISLDSFIDFPIFGVGKSFSYHYMNNQANFLETHPMSPFADLCDNIHTCYNLLLQILIQYGLIGLTMVIFITWKLYKVKSIKDNYIEKSIFCGLICGGMFSYTTTCIPLLIIMGLCIGRISYHSAQKDHSFNLMKHRCWLIPLSIMSTLVMIGYGYSLFLWGEARKLFFSHEYVNAATAYNRITPLLCTNGYFMNEKAKCYFYAGDYEHSIEALNYAKKIRYSSFSEITLGDNYKAMDNFVLAKAS